MSHIRTKSIVAGALLALIVTASSGCEPYYDRDYRYDRYGRNDRYERDRDWRRDRYDRYDDRYYDRENWRYGRDRYSRRDERETERYDDYRYKTGRNTAAPLLFGALLKPGSGYMCWRE